MMVAAAEGRGARERRTRVTAIGHNGCVANGTAEATHNSHETRGYSHCATPNDTSHWATMTSAWQLRLQPQSQL